MDKVTFKGATTVALSGLQGACAGLVTTAVTFTGTAVIGLGMFKKHPAMAILTAAAISLATTAQMAHTDLWQDAMVDSSYRTADKLAKLVYND